MSRFMARRIVLIVIILITLFASGCSYGIIESDMQLPAMTELAPTATGLSE